MKRIYTGMIMAIILVASFFLREISMYLFDILIGVMALFSSYEVSKMLKKANKKNVEFVAIIYPAITYLFLLIGINKNMGLGQLFIGSFLILIIFFVVTFLYHIIAKNKTKALIEVYEYNGGIGSYSFKSAMDTAFNMIYPSFFLLLMILINHISGFGSSFDNISSFAGADLGLFLLILIFSTSIMSDVCAYFSGSLIGGKKLCPKISEHKTIAGAIGAIVGSMLICVVLYIIFNSFVGMKSGFDTIHLSLLGFLAYGLFASIVTQLGDLFESLLKRKAGIKDSGKIFPGHGGFMDRVDGLTFNVVFSLIFFAILL